MVNRGLKCRRVILVVTVLATLSHGACLVRRESANPAYELAQAQGGSVPQESGPYALLVRHGEKDEENPADISLNLRGRIRAAAMAALLFPATGTSRKDYMAPLPECLMTSVPIALAAQVPDIHKTVKRCFETAQYMETQAQKVLPEGASFKLAPFGILDDDEVAAWIWRQSLSSKGQPASISVTVWDHNTMSNIANKVLNTTDVPMWPGDRYDVWWLLDLGKGEVWEYSHELLFEDLKDKSPSRLLWARQ